LVGGLANKNGSTIDVGAITPTVVRMHRIAVGSRAQFIAMNRAIGLHRLKPVIDRVFPFDDVIEAFRYYVAGKYFGRIVVAMG
jgi:NADPH:quinone reductase-like Zn-dependent oxidoreductase